jgi:hypothetical protein
VGKHLGLIVQPAGVNTLQGFGHASVKMRSACTAQALIDNLTLERMVKLIPTGSLFEHAMLQAHIEGIQHRGVGKIGDGTEERVRNLSAGDRGYTQNLCGCGAEALQPTSHQVEYRTIERNIIAKEFPAALDPPEAACLSEGPHNLLRKEGIPRRKAVDGLDNGSIDLAIVQ